MSDIIMCITAVPITPYTAFKGTWSFGATFCYILPLLQVRDKIFLIIYMFPIALKWRFKTTGFSPKWQFWFKGAAIYISSLSLLGIAWDRYKALQLHYRARKVGTSAIFVIVAIDVTSVIMMVPYCLNMEVFVVFRFIDRFVSKDFILVFNPRWPRNLHRKLEWWFSDRIRSHNCNSSVPNPICCQSLCISSHYPRSQGQNKSQAPTVSPATEETNYQSHQQVKYLYHWNCTLLPGIEVWSCWPCC